MTGLCALLLTALLAAFTRFAESVGPVVRCEPCDSHALTLCKPLLPRDCSEPVREPGCGCCLTCALREGQACGIYTSRCGGGLRCRHRPHETRELQALLEGRGVCTPVPAVDKPLSEITVPGNKHDNGEEPNQEEGNSNLTIMTVSTAAEGRAQASPAVTEAKAPPTLSKQGVVIKEKNRMSHRFCVRTISSSKVHTDAHNFSLDSKTDTEYGPCRREIESVLKTLKSTNVLNPRGVHIPNCDRRGFYKKKQCRPSKGRRRGFCWCVDKYGQRLPGYDGRNRGSSHCYSLERK